MPRQRAPALVDAHAVGLVLDGLPVDGPDQHQLMAPDPVRALRRLRRLPGRRALLEREQLHLVQLLRSQRISWSVVAGALGLTTQAVAQRYGRLCPGPG